MCQNAIFLVYKELECVDLKKGTENRWMYDQQKSRYNSQRKKILNLKNLIVKKHLISKNNEEPETHVPKNYTIVNSFFKRV